MIYVGQLIMGSNCPLQECTDLINYLLTPGAATNNRRKFRAKLRRVKQLIHRNTLVEKIAHREFTYINQNRSVHLLNGTWHPLLGDLPKI